MLLYLQFFCSCEQCHSFLNLSTLNIVLGVQRDFMTCSAWLRHGWGQHSEEGLPCLLLSLLFWGQAAGLWVRGKATSVQNCKEAGLRGSERVASPMFLSLQSGKTNVQRASGLSKAGHSGRVRPVSQGSNSGPCLLTLTQSYSVHISLNKAEHTAF